MIRQSFGADCAGGMGVRVAFGLFALALIALSFVLLGTTTTLALMPLVLGVTLLVLVANRKSDAAKRGWRRWPPGSTLALNP